MASQEVKTFYFAGDSKVASSLGTSLEAAGFTKASVSEADVVFTYCVSESVLEDLYYDSKGLLQSSKKDAVLIDLSPSTVSFAQELCAMGSVSEKHVLDAPLVVQNIVLSQAFSEKTNLALLVGGSEEIFKRAEPMLRAIAAKVMWMGKSGCGQAAKVALTLTSAAALVGIVEAYSSLKSSEMQEAVVDQEDYLDVEGNEDREAYEAAKEKYQSTSPISGIFKSFSDAPGGFKEELQEINFSVGAEYAYNNQFFLRAGYYNENKYKGNRKYFTFGAGFALKVLRLDAAYVVATAQSSPLDQTLRFSLSFDMDGIKDLVGSRRR